jgi:hypothetical protein
MLDSDVDEHLRSFVDPSVGTQKLDVLLGVWETIYVGAGFTSMTIPGNASLSKVVRDLPNLAVGLLNFTEVLTFTPVVSKSAKMPGPPASVRNRGYRDNNPTAGEIDQYLKGVQYSKDVKNADVPDPDDPEDSDLHVENGMIMYQERDGKGEVVRMGSIPHGTTMNVVGHLQEVKLSRGERFVDTDDFKSLEKFYSTTPVNLECNVTALNLFNNIVGGANNMAFPSQQFWNPVGLLRALDERLDIIEYTKLTMYSHYHPPGVQNTPFLDRHVKPSAFNSTFFVLTVRDQEGPGTYQLLQYIETIFLEFPAFCGTPIRFPHINVDTLKRVHTYG